MGLFKQPEYRRFNLKPRYWDPEAEARKEREKRIRAELGLPENGDEYIPSEPDCKKNMPNVKENVPDCVSVTQPDFL